MATEMVCYGCDKEIKEGELGGRMKVVYERKRQTFCKGCYERLARIKFGLPLT